MLRLLFMTMGAIVTSIIPGLACEQKLEQHAKISPETCSQYQEEDKKNWCLGRCEIVKNDEYRRICFKAAENRRD